MQSIGIKGELRNDYHTPANIHNGTVCPAVLILENPQFADSVGDFIRRLLRIGMSNPEKDKITHADL
jgi:hypothetical protein